MIISEPLQQPSLKMRHFTRRAGEVIRVGNIMIQFGGYERGKAHLHVAAPDHVSMWREEQFLQLLQEEQSCAK